VTSSCVLRFVYWITCVKLCLAEMKAHSRMNWPATTIVVPKTCATDEHVAGCARSNGMCLYRNRPAGLQAREYEALDTVLDEARRDRIGVGVTVPHEESCRPSAHYSSSLAICRIKIRAARVAGRAFTFVAAVFRVEYCDDHKLGEMIEAQNDQVKPKLG
jgi:hypothetical protein